MLSLDVHFLTGRYAATAYQDRATAEWPPHPARLYSALVEALSDVDEVDVDEAAALDHLAELGPPEILCGDGRRRRVMTAFVPVNDVANTDTAELSRKEGTLRAARKDLADSTVDGELAASAKKKLTRAVEKAEVALIAAAKKTAQAGKHKAGAERVLPWARLRQPRTFPAVVPTHPVASFVWADATLGAAEREALARVGGRVVRLGHSSSFVHVCVADAADESGRTSWVPRPDGDEVLRVAQPGQRAALDAAFERHRGEQPGRVLPAAFQRYGTADSKTPQLHTERSDGRWVAYEFDRALLPPASAAVPVAEAIRAALLHHVGDGAPALLSGHSPGGGVLAGPHLAVLPLPFVGHRHADGLMRGFALSLPSDATADEDRALLEALARMEGAGDPVEREVRVRFARRMLVARRVVDPEESLVALRSTRWARPSRRWATATPIALDGECDPFAHSKAGVRTKARRTATRLIRKAVLRVLASSDALEAEDIRVSLGFDSPVAGAPHPRQLPRFQRSGHRRPRRLVHAILELPEPLCGPLVLGAGRHFGLGLCLPLPDGDLRGRP